MKIDVFNQKGKKLERKVELTDKVFGVEVNDSLLSQYVFVYLSNQRANYAHTKDKSEVRGGGRKPHRQKGTGRARAGSNRSPIWTGGGVTFGPTKQRNWKKSMSRKMKVAALKSAFTKLAIAKEIKVIEKIELKPERLTNQATEIMKNFSDPRKVTIVTADTEASIVNAFKNITNVKVIRAGELNAYAILNAGEMWILEGALEYINQNWK